MTITDAEYAFLKDQLPGQAGTLTDLRKQYFEGIVGVPGTINDLSSAFFKTQPREYWDGAPAPLSIAVVTGATPSADDNLIKSWLEAAGHTVTQTATTTGLTGYDVVVYTDSTAGADSGGSLSATFGVVSTEYTVAALNMSASGGSAGPAHTQWDLSGSHALNSGVSDPLTARGSSSFTWQHTADTLAAGVVILATVLGDATRVCAAVAETGAALTSGVAAGRRAYIPMTSGTAAQLTQEAIDYFTAIVEWAGRGA